MHIWARFYQQSKYQRGCCWSGSFSQKSKNWSWLECWISAKNELQEWQSVKKALEDKVVCDARHHLEVLPQATCRNNKHSGLVGWLFNSEKIVPCCRRTCASVLSNLCILVIRSMQSHGWNLLQLDMWSLIQHHSSGPHLNEDSLYLLATLPYISWLRMRPRLALGSVHFVVYAQKWNRKYSQERKSSTQASGLGVLIVFSCCVYQLRMWCGGLQDPKKILH